MSQEITIKAKVSEDPVMPLVYFIYLVQITSRFVIYYPFLLFKRTTVVIESLRNGSYCI